MTAHSSIPVSGVSLAAHTPTPVDVAPIPPTPEQQQFVGWLREVASYIHAFHDKALMIGPGGELIKADMLDALVNDVALLHAMGMHVVLIHGSCLQVEGQLALRNVQTQFIDGVRATDVVTSEPTKEASGGLRLDIGAAFSQGLSNMPTVDTRMSVVSDNFVTARPVGIVNGVDFQHAELVRKIDAESIQHSLSNHKIVLSSLLGFSSTGQAFSLLMGDVAASTATALKADRLIFIIRLPGIMNRIGKLQQGLSMETVVKRPRDGSLLHDIAYCLQHTVKAMCGGMRCTHVVPFVLDGSILLELFLHDGVGIMISHTDPEYLHEATLDDMGGIVSLIGLLEVDGILVPREHRLLERDIVNFSIIRHDGIIFGCVALYPYPKDGMAEMACLIVSPDSQGTGDGEYLFKHTEVRARALGLKCLFVLTTCMEYWSPKRGFVRTGVNDLPEDRHKLYDQ